MNHYYAKTQGKEYLAESDDHETIVIGDKRFAFPKNSNSSLTTIHIGKTILRAFVQRVSSNEYDVWVKHYCIHVIVEDEQDRLLRQFRTQTSTQSGTLDIKAPMPGLVTEIKVQKNQIVNFGEGLVILEAMKMENEIRSPLRGKIDKILIEKKMIVEKDQPLITMEILPNADTA